MEDVYEIVLTGSECSGKTTSLGYLSEKLSDWGYRVFIVPEMPTIVITGGIHDIVKLAKEDHERFLAVEAEMLRMQRNFRDRFRALAALFPDEKRVIIYDRAEMDMKAFMGRKEFEALVADAGLNYFDVRDSYDGVIHLVTAAKGAEEFYTTENNPARTQTPEEARENDAKILKAWTGHPKLRIIDNSTGFEEKMRRTLAALTSILGVPTPVELERKFLLSPKPDFKRLRKQEGLHYHKTKIEQVYLKSPEGAELRVRKRVADSGTHYYYTEKRPIADADADGGLARNEIERIINEHEYERLLQQRDTSRKPVVKTRYTFAYNSTYCEVDLFSSPRKLSLLEIELTDQNTRFELPPFLDVEREVTTERAFKSSEIARGGDPEVS